MALDSADISSPSSMTAWLREASCWRFASLLFHPPALERAGQLRSLLSGLSEACQPVARELAAVDFDDWAADYHRVVGPGGQPATESAFDPNALAGRGPLLADVAGYYEAFAYRPESDIRETPDHIAVELGFLSYLAVKAAFAVHEGRAEELDVTERAYRDFFERHPAYWFHPFCERLEASGSAPYAGAATLVRLVSEELMRVPLRRES